MINSTIVTALAVLGLIVWAVLCGGKLPVPFRARSCQGKGWRQSFPETPSREIRTFLSLFVEAFAFDEREKLKLSPADQLLDIYHALYPHKWQGDALEFETLGLSLKTKYGLDLKQIWRKDLTLRQLFVHVQHSAEART